jgi:hypothetical protein
MVRHFPIIPLILDSDPESKIDGISSMDYCKQLQVDYNEIAALMKDWYRYTIFARTTIDPKSRVNPAKIERRPGATIPAAPGEVRMETPPSLSNDSFTHLNNLRNNLETISGSNNISRRAVSGLSSDAIRRLDEAGKTILRPKSRLIESAVKKLGELLIDYIQIGYTTERTIRLLGQPVMEMAPLTINQPQVNGGVETMLKDVTVGEYDVYVEPDSTLPKSDIERFDKAIQLAQLGMVDRTAILPVSGLPNAMEIEARMKAKEDELKAVQQQQAAMATTAGAPGEAPPEK